ncbi:hypothetical protein N579_06725 [Corynebacterium pseudodiphtheriticum 090104]|nr:hypothetical protein N579_06725 [Corynebacterium pseudodiphtheriticum 090104]
MTFITQFLSAPIAAAFPNLRIMAVGADLSAVSANYF